MHDFNYVAPNKLNEVLTLLSENKGGTKILAGGTDLLIQMRTGHRQPKLVIDVKHIPELSELTVNEHGLTIGTTVTCRRIWENRKVSNQYPALIDSSSLIGGIQVQGRATIGGNLCNTAPSADTIPTLIVYGAIAHIKNSKGDRQLAVEEICTAPGRTVLADDDLLTKLSIPKPSTNSGAKFLRFIPRNEMDIAVVNVASMVELDDSGKTFVKARIALGSVAPTPIYVEAACEALIGKEVNSNNINKSAAIARDMSSPINDMRGTFEHRKQLVEVLTVRTLTAAIFRAKGEGS